MHRKQCKQINKDIYEDTIKINTAGYFNKMLLNTRIQLNVIVVSIQLLNINIDLGKQLNRRYNVQSGFKSYQRSRRFSVST